MPRCPTLPVQVACINGFDIPGLLVIVMSFSPPKEGTRRPILGNFSTLSLEYAIQTSSPTRWLQATKNAECSAIVISSSQRTSKSTDCMGNPKSSLPLRSSSTSSSSGLGERRGVDYIRNRRKFGDGTVRVGFLWRSRRKRESAFVGTPRSSTCSMEGISETNFKNMTAQFTDCVITARTPLDVEYKLLRGLDSAGGFKKGVVEQGDEGN